MTDVHIINHTHWDREWFLTHEYTTAWVPALIESLEKLAADNPDYDYLFDGQTLCIEDLLKGHPDYRPRVERLISKGQLEIGPCYSQPDWRMISGELQLRNLQLGLADAKSFGGSPEVAWLVDTFGHISQAPQLLSMVGITAAYVWRGVPQMVPRFTWRGSDGTELATINLFGGYRNLYGITKTPDIAVQRLVSETEKLAGSYAGLPVPLFDGYDLDSEPEDPARYYADLEVPDSVTVHASSPSTYAAACKAHPGEIPTIDGELISGKYGATFPGSLSSRAYLKVLHHDAEHAMHRRIEPLSVLAQLVDPSADYTELEAALEAADRTLLQNGVHDCLCGVSIDQVHERMERSYVELLTWADAEQKTLASDVLSGFAPGTYAISTNAMPTKAIVRSGDSAVSTATNGIGVQPVVAVSAVKTTNTAVDRFDWSNDHYTAMVDGSGLTVENVGRVARLIVRADAGDTYSSEPGDVLGELSMHGSPLLVDESELDTTVRTTWSMQLDGLDIEAVVDARFDDGPVIDLSIRLDSTGTAFRVDAEFETALSTGTVHASMPFDVVERSHDDRDLLGHEIDPGLASILMGQREADHVTEFPFHDFVALSADTETRAVIGRGIRSYHSTATGTISVSLRRSVEWLANTGLKLRSGDAGPAMYVPGARCERWIEHRVGFAVLSGSIDESGLHAANESFHNPPLIGTVAGSPADLATEWHLLQAALPLTALRMVDGAPTARLFNPTATDQLLDGEVVGPKVIVTAPVQPGDAPTRRDATTVTTDECVAVRVGASRSRPADDVLAKLRARIADLEEQLAVNMTRQETAEGDEAYRARHENYVLDRERLELVLSLELNERLAVSTSTVSIPDERDPVIAEIGADLNDLRIKRRIYDYVVAALP